MVSEPAKVMAVILALGVVLAGCSTFFLNKWPTEADRMLLKVGDIEVGWEEMERFSPTYSANMSFAENLTSVECAIMSKNTSVIVCYLYVFKSSEDCSELFWYLKNAHASVFVAEDVEIGDSGYRERYKDPADVMNPPSPPSILGSGNSGMNTAIFGIAIEGRVFYANPWNYVHLSFMEDGVLASIVVLVQGADSPIQPWVSGYASYLALVQLQKIDRYA